jgi:hypothetical protein
MYGTTVKKIKNFLIQIKLWWSWYGWIWGPFITENKFGFCKKLEVFGAAEWQGALKGFDLWTCDIEFGDENLSGPCLGYVADFWLKFWTPQ